MTFVMEPGWSGNDPVHLRSNRGCGTVNLVWIQLCQSGGAEARCSDIRVSLRKSDEKKKVWIVLGVVAVLAVIGFMVVRANAPAAGAQGATAQLGRVTQATLSQTVDSSGSLLPESEVTCRLERPAR